MSRWSWLNHSLRSHYFRIGSSSKFTNINIIRNMNIPAFIRPTAGNRSLKMSELSPMWVDCVQHWNLYRPGWSGLITVYCDQPWILHSRYFLDLIQFFFFFTVIIGPLHPQTSSNDNLSHTTNNTTCTTNTNHTTHRTHRRWRHRSQISHRHPPIVHS